MTLSLWKLFETRPAEADRAAGLRLAVAQLLLEIARADFKTGAEEMRLIQGHLANAYGLDAAELDALVTQASHQVEQSVSLYSTVELVNRHCSAEEKTALVGALWRVAYADGRLDPYEEALLRRLADLLYLPHAAFIREKLAAQPV